MEYPGQTLTPEEERELGRRVDVWNISYDDALRSMGKVATGVAQENRPGDEVGVSTADDPDADDPLLREYKKRGWTRKVVRRKHELATQRGAAHARQVLAEIAARKKKQNTSSPYW